MHSCHRLSQVVTQPIPNELLHLPISSFYDDQRGWRLYLFERFVPRHFLQEIMSMHRPYESGDKDEVVWVFSPGNSVYAQTL